MMKTIHRSALAAALCLVGFAPANARDFGVSTSSYGRGTKVTTERGGTAYVGPRGVAAESAGGYRAASGVRGAAYSGPNSSGVAVRGGGAAVATGGQVYARPAAVAPVAPVARVAPAAVPYPAGYVRVLPGGAATVAYRGYSCFYVGGIYYRPVIYQGSTIYVVVP
jgi:hypothetical protein